LQIAEQHTPAAPILPDAAELQRDLAQMAANGVEFAILELNAYQLAHAAAQGISFLAVALTEFFPAYSKHKGYASAEAYRAAKSRLLLADTPLSILPAGLEIPHHGRTLGLGAGGYAWVEECVPYVTEKGILGARFVFCTKEGERVPVFTPVIGDMGVKNAACALLLAYAAGIPLKAAAAVLADTVPKGRMECVRNENGRFVFLDMAYEPETIRLALDTVRPLCTGRLCVLLGSVGGRAEHRRVPLGQVACEGADFVYLTADDPDFEDPATICAQMLDGMREPDRAVIIPDRRAAILRALHEMRPGDLLLIAGKGSNETDLVGGTRREFCERAIVQEAF
jgi:UDP-N-acetylmuramoyl-L-alanyl-D-glutamate--2,6-diaminopimelate ligase